MKITSSNRKCWISVERSTGAHPHEAFAVEALVQIGHGRFQARNEDVHWLNGREFVEDLDKFITNRALSPRLNGTYDSFVGLTGSATSVTLEFAIGDAFRGEKTHRYLLRGSFDIEQDRLLGIVNEFKAITREP